MVAEDNAPGAVIVVGAGPGLGMAIGRAFAAEGHPVAFLARSREPLREFTAELTRSGRAARAYPADAGDPADLSAAINQAADELGPPEVLVYNAAVVRPDKPTELSAGDWDRRLAVNAGGARVAVMAVLPRLRGGHGTLLFTGGDVGLRPSPEYTALSVGKAALRAYALALFEDQRRSGVHAAMVTINGGIGQPGLAPDSIARRYLELHHQPPGTWTAEIIIDPAVTP
jgi:NAD(P)-dependent dehydrogenase (short-subunit alcohol dehydrogenase family)